MYYSSSTSHHNPQSPFYSITTLTSFALKDVRPKVRRYLSAIGEAGTSLAVIIRSSFYNWCLKPLAVRVDQTCEISSQNGKCLHLWRFISYTSQLRGPQCHRHTLKTLGQGDTCCWNAGATCWYEMYQVNACISSGIKIPGPICI